MRSIEVELPPGRLGPRASAFFVDGLGVGLILSCLSIALWKRLVQRRRAGLKRVVAAGGATALVEGPVILLGRVESKEERPPVSVAIEEQGREFRGRNGRLEHEWKEVSRTVRAEAFHMICPGGERIRVEPDRDVLLEAPLGPAERIAPDRRRRLAALANGETVRVEGTLVRGTGSLGGSYREASGGPVVRPVDGARMLIAATSLDERHARGARLHGAWALAFMVAFVVLNGGLFGRFHAMRMFGRVVEAEVIQATTRSAWESKRHEAGGKVVHYEIEARYPDETGTLRTVRDEIPEAQWEAARSLSGRATISFVVGPAGSAQAGRRAAAERDHVIGLMVILSVMVSAYAAQGMGGRAWYERKRLVVRGRGGLT